MAKYVEDVRVLWIVAPSDMLGDAESVFRGVVRTVAVDEREVVPELASWWFRSRPRWSAAARPGYRAQQLAKLWIARRVETPFYLTLDADVVVVGPVDADWLISDGRARTVRCEGGGHRNWYRAASQILGLPESPWEHGVTPCLLSRACSNSLLAFLEAPADAEPKVTGDAQIRGAWRSRLLRRSDWTEYTLYHTFVEAAGAFDSYHRAVAPDDWYGANVWASEDWESWMPHAAFAEGNAYRFSVLQSSAGRSAADVAHLLESFLI